MMTASEISEYLNNAERNAIADIFLGCCGFDGSSPEHRLIRNAVLLFPHCVRAAELYDMLSAVTDTPAAELAERIAVAVAAVDKPVHLSFNERFAASDYDFGEKRRNVEMPELTSPDDILSFLGATLAYIISVNYSI